MTFRLAFALAWLTALVALEPAWAQSGGLFSGRRPTNPNQVQGIGSSGSTGSMPGTSTGSMLGGAAPMLGTDILQLGVPGIGQAASAATGGFVGRSSTDFVGRRAAGGQTTPAGRGSTSANALSASLGRQTSPRRRTGLTGPTGLTRPNNMTQRNNFAPQSGFTGGRPGQTTSQTAVHVRQRVAFARPETETSQVAAALRARFERLGASRATFGQVQLAINEDGVVTLQGTVPGEEDKRLVEAMVRLEPGVRAVRNDLTVAP